MSQVNTTPNYWDCECPARYIHAKTDRRVCPLCGADEIEDCQPDSRVNELAPENMFIAFKTLDLLGEYNDPDECADGIGMCAEIDNSLFAAWVKEYHPARLPELLEDLKLNRGER